MKKAEELKTAVKELTEDLAEKLGDKEKLHELADKVKENLEDRREVIHAELEMKKDTIAQDIKAIREERDLRREVECEAREMKEILKGNKE